jgi:hypothetical protein
MEQAGTRMSRRKMHQTTVRFGADLWEALEVEAERLEVSVAQYVRDAALKRLSYEAGQRAEQDATGEPSGRGEAVAAQERAESEVSQSTALWAQGRLARQRAVELRSQTEQTRAKLVHPQT